MRKKKRKVTAENPGGFQALVPNGMRSMRGYEFFFLFVAAPLLQMLLVGLQSQDPDHPSPTGTEMDNVAQMSQSHFLSKEW